MATHNRPAAAITIKLAVFLMYTSRSRTWILVGNIADFFSPFLALRTEVRAALRHQDPPDRRRAGRARLSLFAVYPVLQLKTAAASFRIDVIGNGRAACLDGLQQHLPNRAMQARGALAGEPRT